MLWRDFGRREIELWPRRAQWVFYGAVALLVVDLGWFFLTPLNGLDALAFFLVAAAAATPRSAPGATSTATAERSYASTRAPTPSRRSSAARMSM